MGGVEDHPSGRKRTNHLEAIPNGNTVSADAQAEECTMRRHSRKKSLAGNGIETVRIHQLNNQMPI